jgi:septal ring factor EnvC (AmiA/AmiB activator)
MRTPVIVASCATVALLALPAGAASPPKQQIAQLKRQVAALKTKVKQLEKQKADLEKDAARSTRRENALGRYAATEARALSPFRTEASRPAGTSVAPACTATGCSG